MPFDGVATREVRGERRLVPRRGGDGGLRPGHDRVGCAVDARAHEAAPRAISARDARPNVIDRFSIVPSSANPTGVLVTAATPLPRPGGTAGEDWAEGFAHWSWGRWTIVLGPGGGLCHDKLTAVGIPARVARSLVPFC